MVAGMGAIGLAMSCSPVDNDRLGCITNNDCKGERECVAGECIQVEKDAYVAPEEVASCTLDKYVCIDEVKIGSLDTCGLTELYKKCLDGEICNSGECVEKPCPEFSGKEFYEGFDEELDKCKWDYNNGQKGEVVEGYWMTGGGQGIIEANEDPGCGDFTLTARLKLTKEGSHRSFNISYNGIGMGIGYTNDDARFSLHCPIAFSNVDDFDTLQEHEYRLEVKGNIIKAYVDGEDIEEYIEEGYLTAVLGGEQLHPPWVCEEPNQRSVLISADSSVVDYVKLECD